MFVKPSYAKHTINVDSDIQGDTYQAVDSPCEVVGILATAQGSAVFIRIYDTATGQNDPSHRKVSIAANIGESTQFTPVQPMNFEKGVYLEFEQGGGVFGSEITLVINK